MASEIVEIKGPKDSKVIPVISTGILLFNKIKNAPRNKTAVIDDSNGNILTYGELLEKSINFAIYFKKIGLKKGDVISIITENNSHFIVLFLAALFEGITINCLSYTYTKGEYEKLLSTSKPKLIFCSKTVETYLKELAETTLTFIEDVIIIDENFSSDQFGNITEKDNDFLNYRPIDLDPNNDIVYILTSSGTTGFPKCIMIPNICARHALLYFSDENYGRGSPDDVLYFIVPFMHLYGLILLVGYLYCTSTAIVSKKFQPRVFLNAIQKYKINKLNLVPTLMNFLAKTPIAEEYNLDSVEDIVCAGSNLSTEIAKTVKLRFRNAKVRQLYGLTELGCTAMMQTWEDVNCSSNVGKLIHDLEAVIWDRENGMRLGPNQVGELLIRGPIAMKGYINNKKETEEAFDDEGFLRTGDAAYYDDDENFYVVDRYKELIKYKGFQVAPAEIEEILLKHPGVKDCAVVPKPDEKAGEVPTAFVAKQFPHLTEQNLIDLVAENLSVNKRLYGGVIFVDELPKNSMGKILRNSLKIIASSSP